MVFGLRRGGVEERRVVGRGGPLGPSAVWGVSVITKTRRRPSWFQGLGPVFPGPF